MSDVIKVGYWNCRGYAHPIRMILEYLEIPYEYSSPQCDSPPTFRKSKWKAEKYKILGGFDFPNLPFLQDGQIKLTHHTAIMQYIGRKHGLYPMTDQEHMDVDMIREQVADLKQLLIGYMYFPRHREKGSQPSLDEISVKKKKLGPEIQINISDIARKYGKQVVNAQQSDGKIIWMAGRKITYIDFLVYEQIDYARNLFPDVLGYNNDCSFLKRFMSQFEELPPIKNYMMSDRYQMFPFYAERSYLGTSVETCYGNLN